MHTHCALVHSAMFVWVCELVCVSVCVCIVDRREGVPKRKSLSLERVRSAYVTHTLSSPFSHSHIHHTHTLATHCAHICHTLVTHTHTHARRSSHTLSTQTHTRHSSHTHTLSTQTHTRHSSHTHTHTHTLVTHSHPCSLFGELLCITSLTTRICLCRRKYRCVLV